VGDGVVDHDPLRVVGAANGGEVDMIREAELTDDGAEEATPLPVVAGGEVERDGVMGPDGDRMDHRGWTRGRGDAVLGAAPIAASRAGCLKERSPASPWGCRWLGLRKRGRGAARRD
jgi:hypothetical protein